MAWAVELSEEVETLCGRKRTGEASEREPAGEILSEAKDL